MNPIGGISVLMCVVIVLLLGFQFSLCYVPQLLGFGSIPEYTNLLCMAMGACSVVWFTAWKVAMRFIAGSDDAVSK